MFAIITEAEKEMFISACGDTRCSKCMFYRYHNCCGLLQTAPEFLPGYYTLTLELEKED